jgi:uncharacterized protein (TIRG00374 family)
VRHVARPAIGTLVLLVVINYLLLPQIAGARRSISLLADINPWWLGLAAIAECGSLMAYSWLTITAVGWKPLRYRTALQFDLSTLALSHVVPAGSVVGLGVGFGLLVREGVPPEKAASGKTIEAIGSAVVLNVMFGISVVLALILHGGNALYTPIALAALVLLLVAAMATVLILRGQERVANAASQLLGKLPRIDPAAGRRLVDSLATTLRAFGRDRAFLTRFMAWAATNWLLDAFALWCAVRAFGHSLGPVGLMVAYCLASVAGAIPITPGGLGVVEGVLVPALVAFETTRGVAILGVLGWRLLQFWLPIPVGLACYAPLVLGRRPRRTDKPEPEPLPD